MSHGSHEREHPRDVQCQHCGRFYRNDGIHGHEANCPYDAVDDTIVELVNDGGRDVTPSGSSGDPSPPQDSETMGGDPPAVTDGGPQAPPEPETVDVQDDDQDDVDDQDDLPERYVEVDQYVEAVEEEVDHIDTDELRSRLSDFDVVDVEATTADNIVAFERGEVAR